MSGMYHPICLGEIEGHKCGLGSDLNLYNFTRNIDLLEFNVEYWIGFGAGYSEGQLLRNRLRNFSGIMKFEEYIECCKFLFLKKQFYNFNQDEFLNNIEKWEILKIEENIWIESLKLLNENKLQRSLNELFQFYRNNFQLKALAELEVIIQKLRDLRNIKRNEKNYNSSNDRIIIIQELKNFIDKYGIKT